jgi:hypothetical protein
MLLTKLIFVRIVPEFVFLCRPLDVAIIDGSNAEIISRSKTRLAWI